LSVRRRFQLLGDGCGFHRGSAHASLMDAVLTRS
jgi:hypothetical protein